MDINWQELFVPKTSLLELILRGTVMYIALLAVLRILVRRHVGSLSLIDLLLMVLIADAAQNGMAAEYRSVTEGLVLCLTLVGWNLLFDWLAYRYAWFAKLLEPSPLPLIRHGRLQRANMQRELMTEDELISQLRQQGIEDLRTVKYACLESDGGVSAIVESAHSSRKASPPKQRGMP
jgi:uncharacterized membrane protein YcaP (DUF421 family)